MTAAPDPKLSGRKFLQTIQGRLSCLLLILLIPILLIEIVIYRDRFQERRSEELQANLELARATAKTFDAYVQNILGVELAVGLAITARPLPAEQCTRLLEKSLSAFKGVRDISWADPTGTTTHSSNPAMVGINYSDRTYISKVLSGSEWVIGELVAAKTTGEPAFAISRGIRDDKGVLLGIVFVVVTPERLVAVLGIQRSKDSGIGILDNKGLNVYRYPPRNFTWAQRNWLAAYPVIEYALRSKEVVATVVSISTGKKRLVAFTPITAIGWVASAGCDEDDIFDAIISRLQPHAIMMSFVLLVAVGISMFSSRKICDSVRTLRNQVLTLGNPVKSNPIEMSGIAELDDLAHAFDKMTGELHAREMERKQAEDALRESEARLRLFIEHAPAALAMFDREMRYLSVSRRWLTDYSPREPDLIGLSLYEVFPEIPESWKEVHRRGLAGEVVSADSDRFEREDGAVQWVRWEVRPWRDATDAVGGIVIFTEDITERKLAEDALYQSREWFRTTLGSIGDAVIATDASGCISYLNPIAEALTGRSTEDALGLPSGSVFRIINELDGRPAENIVDRVLREGRMVELANHTALISRDGRVIPIEDSAAPITDGSGEIVGVVIVFHDVTEKRRALDRLSESEERFRVMANAIPQLAWIAEADGYIFWYNQRWYDYTGAKPEEMEGWGWQSVHAPETLPDVMERWQDSISTGKPFEMVFPLRSADGEFREFLTCAMPVKNTNGDIIRWCGTNTDITERRQIEEGRARLAAIVESSDDAIIGKTLDGVITSWNRGAEVIYGYSAEEIVGRSISVLSPPDRPDEEPAIRRRIISGGDFKHHETLRRRKDGRNIHVSLTVSAIRDASGKIMGASTIARDITERKLLEGELRQSRDELERRVRERTAELGATVARLELINQELREFAHVASHDLQEPLRKIQTFCDMAGKRCGSALDPTAREYLDRVTRSAERMRQLLHDLLQYSSVATRSEPFKVVELGEIVREAADVFEERIRNAGVRVEIEEMPQIEADETQLLRLFLNLIGNALKFRSEESPRIVIHAKPDGRKHWDIYVIDNGIGFEQQFAERIFKPFQRLHKRNEYEGTGMGLAICRKIAERHGGSIRAESEEGKGATFIIRLPVMQDRWDGD